MVVKHSQATAPADIPAVSAPNARSLKACDIRVIVLCGKTAHAGVVLYCGQPGAPLCNNPAVYSVSPHVTPVRWMDDLGRRSAP